MANVVLPEDLAVTDLECVMVDLPAIDIQNIMGEDYNEDDLFYGDIPELSYAKGAVAEDNAHVTLLFGIHPSPDYEQSVHLALDGWDIPSIFIEDVGFFPSRIEGQDYVAVVAHVVKTAPLLAGRNRLTVLRHTDAYPEYKPHVTLAYLKGSADKDLWISKLDDALAESIIEPLGLNLGLDD